MAYINIVGYESGPGASAGMTEFPTTAISLPGSVTVQRNIVHAGDYAIRATCTGAGAAAFNVRRPDHSKLDIQTGYIRFWFYPYNLPTGSSGAAANGDQEVFCLIDGSDGAKLRIHIDSTGRFVVRAFNLATCLQTGTSRLSTGKWHLVEIGAAVPGIPGNSNYEIRLSGRTEITGTGNLRTGTITDFRFGRTPNIGFNNCDWYFDDFCISDSQFPGTGQVVRLDITRDAIPTGWNRGGSYTGLTGSENWRQLTDVPSNSNNSYLVSPLSSGSVNMSAIESTTTALIAGTVNAVKVYGMVQRNAATNSNIELCIAHNNVTGKGIKYGSPSAYTGIGAVFGSNPSTNVPWTMGEVDNATIGIRTCTSTEQARVSSLYLFVDYVPGVFSTGVSLWGESSPQTLLSNGYYAFME